MVIETNPLFSYDTGDPDHGTDNCGYVKDTWRWKNRECDRNRPFICEGNGTSIKHIAFKKGVTLISGISRNWAVEAKQTSLIPFSAATFVFACFTASMWEVVHV